MPLHFNRDTIPPQFKISGSEKEDMKNGRPISMIPFISNLLKR